MKKLRMLVRWLNDKLARKFLYSFKSTILSVYLPIIIFFIFITGMASYLLAAAQIEDNAYRNINTIVFQTGNYLDNRFADALQQLTALSNEPDILTVMNKDPEDISPEDYLKVQSHVNGIRSVNGTLIDSIYINFHNGKFIFFRGDDSSTMIKFIYMQYRSRYKDNPYDVYWQNSHIGYEKDEKHVSLFKLFGKENAKINGIILFNLRYDFFEKVFSTSLLNKSGYLMLVSPEEAMTFKKIDEKYQVNSEIVKQLQEAKTKEGQLEFDNPQGKKMVVIYNTLLTNQWKLAAVFTQDEILDRVRYIKYITLSLIVLLVIVAVFLTNVLAIYITKPISVLTDSMKRIRGENINFVSDSHPLNEMGVLNQGVEDLVERVKNLVEQINIDQETKRQLEFSVIQTQIHPHFLYNTLYSIKGLCDMGLNEDASAMITALSNFFRVSISCGKEIISVEEEMSHIRNYLFIQEMRYGDAFSYEINVKPDILSYSIVKLTLQPLVENAIYHGVKQKRGIGWIKVNGYEQDGLLCFEVQDNGLGMSCERLQEVRGSLNNRGFGLEKVGLGVRSVHERLQLHYGKEAGLQIESKLSEGTIVKVIIPMKQLEDKLDV
ncbi:sensor histidine kinase [Pelosinus sp. IPA-1]|uniref:sensor histidine kinase n=1 Tax=Pelosinus sp. IPA-1 TaxID=3029569 RepID=UPI00243626EC|nr:sensor histidine kinase [Pelosinus sp. IPA-1]GMA97308.1 histidine kinase [Pelosinus sp. IPA-1]